MYGTKQAALILALPILVLLLFGSFLFGCKEQGKQDDKFDIVNPMEANWDHVRATGEGDIFAGTTADGDTTAAFLLKNVCYLVEGRKISVVTMGDSTFETLRTVEGIEVRAVWGPVLQDLNCCLFAVPPFSGASFEKPSVGYYVADAIFKFYRKGPYNPSNYDYGLR